jgi:DNA-binding FadR family transcriptional regulator
MKQKVMRFMAVSNRYFTTDELAEWHMILIRSIRSGDPEVAANAFVEHMHSYKTIHY